MVIAGIIIAAIAAIAAIASAVVAWQQRNDAQTAANSAQHEAAAAIAAARDAADAAQRSAVAADKSAKAHETLAKVAETQATMPPWDLQHRSGDTYEAINGGPTTVYAVKVDGDTIHRGPVVKDMLGAGSSVSFMAAGSFGDSSTITITWHDREDRSDPERSWSRDKPARPPRQPRPTVRSGRR